MLYLDVYLLLKSVAFLLLDPVCASWNLTYDPIVIIRIAFYQGSQEIGHWTYWTLPIIETNPRFRIKPIGGKPINKRSYIFFTSISEAKSLEARSEGTSRYKWNTFYWYKWYYKYYPRVKERNYYSLKQRRQFCYPVHKVLSQRIRNRINKLWVPV